MNKSLLILSLGLGCAFGAAASPLTPEEALRRLSDSSTRGASIVSAERLALTTRQTDGAPALYVFDNAHNGGFVVLSADDVAAPLLGYSDTGSFDPSTMSPEMRWWLGEYSRQIEYAVKNGADKYLNLTTRADRAAIAPLVKSKWNQGAPYNDMTPTVDGVHCVTGCVATAMAQVVNYWKYPAQATGTGECEVTLSSGATTTLEMNLGEEKFDWPNIMDTYGPGSTEAQNHAVAYLMKACGYAVNMGYTSNESGAAAFNVAGALINNFGFNPNIQYCQRDYYSASDWDAMVYAELSAKRPIVYAGQSTQGGHCFVCDGYSDGGYFHFNWGWGGMSDGYFLLNALNPDSLGIGANGGGYNFGQEMIRGIQIQEGEAYTPLFVQQGSLKAKASANALTLSLDDTEGGWFNMSSSPIVIDFGYSVEGIDGTSSPATYKVFSINSSNVELQEGYGWSGANEFKAVISTSLPNGTYKVTVCFKPQGGEWTPVNVATDSYNYVVVTKSGNKVTVKSNPAIKPTIKDVKLLTDLYYGAAVKMEMTIANTSEKEITQSFYPILYDGNNAAMIADGLTLTIQPGETVTKDFIALFELLSGQSAPTADKQYTMYLYNPAVSTSKNFSRYSGWSSKVTMKVRTEEMDITVSDFKISGVEPEKFNAYDLYKVTDPSAIPFTCTITNNGNFFSNVVDIVIFKFEGFGEEMRSVDYVTLSPLAILNQGESATLTGTLEFSSAVLGQKYVCMPYIGNDQVKDLAPIFFEFTDSGVGEVVGEDTLSVSYDRVSGLLTASASETVGMTVYSADGKAYTATTGGSETVFDMSQLPGGIYIVKATTASGKTKTVKIAR